MSNPLNSKALQNNLVAMAQASIPPNVIINGTNGVTCPHGHPIAPRSSYISFRLAAALPNTHSWGLYISQQDVVDLSTTLQSAGWDQSTSADAANQMIVAALSSIFHLDCTLMNVHEIMFLQYGMAAYQNGLTDVISRSGESIHVCAGDTISYLRANFPGSNDDWWKLLSSLGLDPSPFNNQILEFVRDVIEQLAKKNLGFSSPDARRRFILNLPVYNNRKPFPGLDLPTTIVP